MIQKPNMESYCSQSIGSRQGVLAQEDRTFPLSVHLLLSKEGKRKMLHPIQVVVNEIGVARDLMGKTAPLRDRCFTTFLHEDK
jgi:hypothetical protein